uniref:Carboxypeptidase-like regulatory domain-containing protein n=1 Tax=Roseihalotalea indica TaxID=2867963 RepID=A0AA49JIB0_9BACT|nr:carboxypeptidase-like regulatory domain-containing protein [Tunicatimonas sp. TK19036]
MRLTLTFIIFLITTIAKGQISISGQVILKGEDSTVPGATIREKGTSNGILTDLEGRFILTVKKLPITLEIFSIGAVPKEVLVEEQKELLINLKLDCNRHTFDHQLLGFYLASGVINNPFGGEFHLSFPAFWRMSTLKGKIGYQTNFDYNENIYGQVAFDHILFTCDYDLDVKINYQKVSVRKDIDFEIQSAEAHFNLDKNYSKIRYARFIVGLSKISYASNEDNSFARDTAPIIGLGAILGEWWRLMVVGKVILYDNLPKYDIELSRDFRRIDTFIRYQKLESFNEISVGLGTHIGYRLKKRNN